jgi:hypothetical protein
MLFELPGSIKSPVNACLSFLCFVPLVRFILSFELENPLFAPLVIVPSVAAVVAYCSRTFFYKA